MRALTYIVSDDKLAAELEWLRDNFIFPATEKYWNFDQMDKQFTRIGVIVDSEAEMTIKLRVSKIHTCDEYKRPK
jgi:hypothetical protein